jgi:hypothetical protein
MPLIQEGHVYVRERGSTDPYVYAAYDIRRRKNLDHDLMIARIHVALHTRFNVVLWKQSREKLKGALNEDAYCVLGVRLPERTGQLHYFIEADTGSERYDQIDDKVERYISNFKKRGKPTFTLIVTQETKRAAELVRRAAAKVPVELRRLFLFTGLDQLEKDPLGCICRTPHEAQPSPLIPVVGLQPCSTAMPEARENERRDEVRDVGTGAGAGAGAAPSRRASKTK